MQYSPSGVISVSFIERALNERWHKSAHSQELSPENLAQQVCYALDHNRDFCRQRFKGNDRLIAQVIDRDFQEQLVIEAEDQALARFAELSKSLPDGDTLLRLQALIDAKKEAIDTALLRRDNFLAFWRKCEDYPMVSTFGSARDKVWHSQLDALADQIAERCVEAGISVINGGGPGVMDKTSGAHRKWIENFRAESREFVNKWCGFVSPEVILVLLKFYGDSREPRNPYGSPDFVFGKVEAFLSRTALLYAAGVQGASLFYPGGIGTLEEILKRTADRKLADRVLVTSVPPKGDAPCAFLISPKAKVQPEFAHEVTDSKPLGYYDGMVKLFEVMKESGAAQASDFIDINIVDEGDLKNPEVVAALVVEQTKAAMDRSKIAEDRREGLPERALVRLVGTLLRNDEEFNKRHFSHKDMACLRLVQTHYREQVREEVLKNLLDEYRSLDPIQQSDRDTRKALVNKALKLARHWAGAVHRLIDVCKDRETITIVGTSKTSIWENCADLEIFSRQLVKDAVAKGTTLVVAGDGREGTAKRLWELWVDAMKHNDTDPTRIKSRSQFVRVQLKLEGEVVPAKSLGGYREILGPPMLSIISRTPLLGTLGIPKAVIVYPGGPVEAEVGISALLGAQLSHSVSTMYRSSDELPRRIPQIMFLNARAKGSKTGFWDPLEQQLETIRLAGAADAKDLRYVEFLVPSYGRNWDVKALGRVVMHTRRIGDPALRREIILGRAASSKPF